MTRGKFHRYLLGFGRFSVLAVLLYMPLHVFVSQSASMVTGGLDIWKNAKDVVFLALFLIFFALSYKNVTALHKQRSIQCIAIYIGFIACMALIFNNNMEAEVLGVVHDTRFLLAYVFGLFVSTHLSIKEQNNILKFFVFIVALVSVLGIAQVMFIDNNALRSYGYDLSRGTPPAAFIGEVGNSTERAFSTLKDPNSLGSFLLVGFFVTLLTIKRRLISNKLGYVLLILEICCLYFTYSRSAELGLIIALVIVVLAGVGKARINKKRLGLISLLIIAGITILFLLRNIEIIRTNIFHDTNQSVQTSDGLRIQSYQNALDTVLEKPFGYGPGSAGPASIRNNSMSTIPENYYLQIAIEYGVIGLLLFYVVMFNIFRSLIQADKGSDTIFIVAALSGVMVAALFVPILTNEAVAYSTYLLAGLLSAPLTIKSKENVFS